MFYPKTAWDISPRPFFPFPRWKHMPPYSQFLSDSPSQGSSTYPRDRRNSLRRSSCQSMAFIGPRQRSEKKTKGTASAVPPVNPWLSSDRASGLRKRQKGQLASSPCQFMAFIGPRQRSGKKTKGTACAVPLSIYGFHRTAPAVWEKDKRDSLRCPPVNLWLSSDRASGLEKRQKGQLALSLLSMG